MTTQEMLQYNLNALDQVNNKIEGYLDKQYNKGRLKGSDYANVYAQLISTAIQTTMSQGFNANQQENQNKQTDAQIKLMSKQEDSEVAKKELTNAQKDVAVKQAKSFDQTVKLKLFKNQMDTFAMIYSSNPDGSEIPDVLKKSNVNSLYNEINNSVRI